MIWLLPGADATGLLFGPLLERLDGTAVRAFAYPADVPDERAALATRALRTFSGTHAREAERAPPPAQRRRASEIGAVD